MWACGGTGVVAYSGRKTFAYWRKKAKLAGSTTTWHVLLRETKPHSSRPGSLQTVSIMYGTCGICRGPHRAPAAKVADGSSLHCGRCRGIGRIPRGQSGRSQFWKVVKYSASSRFLKLGLSKGEALKTGIKSCFWCNTKPVNLMNKRTRTAAQREYGAFVCHGLDRIDNSVGYIKGNVVACCKICNRGKGASTLKEWIAWTSGVGIVISALRCRQYRVSWLNMSRIIKIQREIKCAG